MSYFDQLHTFWWDKDDFIGDSLDDRWSVTGSAGGSVAVVDNETGGVCRLTTDGDDDDYYQLDWGNIRSLHVDKKATLEFKLKMGSTSLINGILGLYFDNDDRIYFWYDTDQAHTNWFLGTRDGGAITQVNSGVAVNTAFHVFKIECSPVGEIHFYIDGVQCSNSPITTNITSEYLQPWFFLRTREASTKYCDIDYVAWGQFVEAV